MAEEDISMQVIYIIDNQLYNELPKKLEGIKPLIERLNKDLTYLITGFSVLKNKEDNEVLIEIPDFIAEAETLSTTLSINLEDFKKMFKAAINELTLLIEKQTKDKDARGLEITITAQRRLIEESDYIDTIKRQLLIFRLYKARFGIENPSHVDNIIKANSTDEVIAQLTLLKGMLENVLLDAKRSIKVGVEQTRSMVLKFPKTN